VEKALYQGFLDTLAADTPLERRFLIISFQQYQEEHPQDPQSLEKLLGEFNALLPLTEADLREDEVVAPPTPEPTIAAPASLPKPPVAASVKPTAAPLPSRPEAVAPVAAAVAESVPATPSLPRPEVPRHPLTEAAPATAVPLYEKLKAERPMGTSLGETLRSERPNGTTLAEKAPKVESLREAISINQRFSFINELFNGENMEYHAAIQHLDGLPNADVARRYINEDLGQKYNWVRKEEHVNKLLKLIERKFA
jgi:hypothetical protein